MEFCSRTGEQLLNAVHLLLSIAVGGCEAARQTAIQHFNLRAYYFHVGQERLNPVVDAATDHVDLAFLLGLGNGFQGLGAQKLSAFRSKVMA